MKKLLLLTIVGLFSLESFAERAGVYSCSGTSVYKDGAFWQVRDAGCSGWKNTCSRLKGSYNEGNGECTLTGYIDPSALSGPKKFNKK
jgi:hypothetical protein